MIETKENFDFESAAYLGSFLSEFCMLWSAKYFKSLDKYLRNIYQADDPCWDWLNLPLFDSKGPAFWSPFCLFSKNWNPTVHCARVRKLISKWISLTGIMENAILHLPTLVSLDFLPFVMEIIIAGEVTGNPLSGLVLHV